MEDVRLAVSDYERRVEQLVANATATAAARRVQVVKRHMLEREQLLAVDAAAAILEVMQLWEVDRAREAEDEENIKQLEDQEVRFTVFLLFSNC